MKNLATGTLILLTLSYCSQPTQKKETEANVAFSKMLEDYYQDGLKLFPINATFQGDNRYNHLLRNEITQSFIRELQQYFESYLAQLDEFDRPSLLAEEQISYDVLKWECEINLSELKYPANLLPIDQFWTSQLMIGQLASGASAQPFNTRQDYDNWLARLDIFVHWCDSAIVNMRKGIDQEIILPKSLSEKVIPQLATWKDGPAQTHHFYTPANNIPESVSEEDRQAIQEQYSEMVSEKILPAVNRLHDFFQNEYLPRGRASSGIGDLKSGDEWYQSRIQLYTTTDMTADEIFELGKSEVARIRGEMEKVMQEVRFEGGLNEFFDHVRTRQDLMPFKDPKEVIDNFNAIHEKIKPNPRKAI